MSLPLKSFAKRMLRPFNLTLSTQINGENFKVPVIRGIGASNLNVPEPWMVDMFKRLLTITPDSAVMDVGVNLGQTLLKVKSVKRNIPYLGLEPNPFCVHYSQELIDKNNFPNCEIIPIGLADQGGLIHFFADGEADSAASMIDDLRPGKTSIRRQHIPILRFDEISTSLLPENLRIVKVDVEGAELEVLQGMSEFLKRNRPWICCEVLYAYSEQQVAMLKERNGQLRQLLREENYECFRVSRQHQLDIEP